MNVVDHGLISYPLHSFYTDEATYFMLKHKNHKSARNHEKLDEKKP